MIAGLFRLFVSIIVGTLIWCVSGPLQMDHGWLVPFIAIVFLILDSAFDNFYIKQTTVKIHNMLVRAGYTKNDCNYFKQIEDINYSTSIKYFFLAVVFFIAIFWPSVAYIYILSCLSIECAGNIYNISTLRCLIKNIEQNEKLE